MPTTSGAATSPMRARATSALLLLVAACAPLATRRAIAEWEPTQAVLVAYPFRLPDALLQALAGEARLVVLVGNVHAEAAARRHLARLAIGPELTQYVVTTVQTPWTRDYGPIWLDLGAGRRALADCDYIETPIRAADAPPPRLGETLRYPGRSPGDDRTNVELAHALGWQREAVGAFVPGGNFLVDGQGTAFCTRLLIDENLTRCDEETLRRLLRDQLGITRLVVLENTEAVGIQHIDCWMKVLDAETLLVKRVPAGHFEHARIERNVAHLAGLRAPTGNLYRIVRIDCPPFARSAEPGREADAGQVPAYTNSLIVNGTVFVPLFAGPGDAMALQTYRSALPGHRVLGFRYAGWQPFDALHCRTRGIPR